MVYLSRFPFFVVLAFVVPDGALVDLIVGALVDLIVGAFVDLIVGALVDFIVGALVDFVVGALVDLIVGALVDLTGDVFDALPLRFRNSSFCSCCPSF